MMANKTVLVIDDDQDVFETLSFGLESFGYHVIWAKDGTEGCKKAEEVNPNLIVLDFSLANNETGLDILHKLKSHSSVLVRTIPVVMLTGHEEYERACLDAGAGGYITKPFDLFQLKEKLAQLLPG